MQFIAAQSRTIWAAKLHSYACQACDIRFSELDTGDAPLPERVCVLNFEAGLESIRQ